MVRKNHVIRHGVDCTLEVEFLDSDGDIWKFIAQFASSSKELGPTGSFSIKIPEYFLQSRISKELDEEYITELLFKVVEQHANDLDSLAPGGSIHLIKEWLEAEKLNG